MARIKGDNGDDELTGTQRDDEIRGLGGEDSLHGRAGADLIIGGTGDDHLEGDLGRDTLDGGAGQDTVDFAAAGGVRADLEKGRASGEGRDVLIGIEHLTGAKGDDTFLGNDDGNRLAGVDGDDDIDGRGGEDTLRGGRGGDTLEGGSGDDTFDYDDKLDSKPGAGSRDLIVDFTSGQDKIDLFDIDANEVGGTPNDAFTFIGNGPVAFTAAGQIRFNGGVVEGEVNGDGMVDFEIEVSGVTTLADTDFVF